jgi:hypothetical protein
VIPQRGKEVRIHKTPGRSEESYLAEGLAPMCVGLYVGAQRMNEAPS